MWIADFGLRIVNVAGVGVVDFEPASSSSSAREHRVRIGDVKHASWSTHEREAAVVWASEQRE